MAHKASGSHDVPPVVPSRSRTSSHYTRSISASDVMASSVSSHTNNNNNNRSRKPPAVPRNSLIRSNSAQLYRQQGQVSTSPPIVPVAAAKDPGNASIYSSNNNNNNTHNNNLRTTASADVSVNKAITPDPVIPTALSRSFTFESSTGVRRKIPVTPVLSTGPRHHASQANQHHDTLHYRHGTLVFPTSVVGRLTVDVSGSSSSSSSVSSPSMSPSVAILPTTPPSTPVTPPTLFINKPFVTVDYSVLKLCQDGDAGALSRYLSLYHEKVPGRTLNATDPSGKSGLLHAAMTGNLAVARQLVKLSGLEINQADNEGNTALHLAAQAGHADVVSLLTLCPSLVIDTRNLAGLTALMKAALQGRVRCTRLLLLAGASPVLRDFGRGLCSSEWARLTGRVKCAEIIEKYMEKMQLNPGLGLKSLSVAGSEPSLLNKRSSLVLLPSAKTKDSWVKNTLKKAIRIVSGGSDQSANFSIASQLTGSGVLGASVLLPGDPTRRSSLPVLLPDSRVDRFGGLHGHRPSSSSHSSSSSFVVPRIQVSYCNSSTGGSIPPPPSSSAPKTIPAESRPQTTSRQRSRSSTRS